MLQLCISAYTEEYTITFISAILDHQALDALLELQKASIVVQVTRDENVHRYLIILKNFLLINTHIGSLYGYKLCSLTLIVVDELDLEAISVFKIDDNAPCLTIVLGGRDKTNDSNFVTPAGNSIRIAHSAMQKDSTPP